MNFDVDSIRNDFPILKQTTKSGKPLVYFDNAATAQKPQCVIDAIVKFYSEDNANIHRGVYELSDRTTTAYENARQVLKNFVKASDEYEAVFTSGATEALNIVAQCWGADNLKAGDEILLSEMEHHANIVPWQFIAKQTGAVVRAIKITPSGELDIDDFSTKLSEKTKIVSVAHASNVLGTINDIESIAKQAKSVGAKVSIDAAQSSPHMLEDLSSELYDFVSLSSHKCFAPTGSGVLYAKREILNSMRPWKFGGDMIENVAWAGTSFRSAPERFEAGTPNIESNIVFAQACKYLMSLDIEAVEKHEQELLALLSSQLSEIEGLRIFGTSKNKVSVVSFAVDGVHPNDISVMLNNYGIATRTGHHCAEPLMNTLGVSGTCRASLAFYNTIEEVEFFVKSLKRILNILR
ncbi:MAG: SufS family cysteine desulfurase [Verrucomicrobiaceae bacterium]|nr:SufS family cysteine desulfurase [Verrucomicrobiaceae bacterium]